MEMKGKTKPIIQYIIQIDYRNKERIITAMKLVYWVVQEDLQCTSLKIRIPLCVCNVLTNTKHVKD
jgi:hypothetical protein